MNTNTDTPNRLRDESHDDGLERALRRRRIAVSALVTALVVWVAVVAIGSSPTACGLCHSTLAKAQEGTAHASTRCYDCHMDNGMWGFPEEKNVELTRMYPAALLGRGMTSPARETGRAACLECHADVLVRVTAGGGVSIKHAVCAEGPTCDSCHSATAHGETVRWVNNPSMEECVACHESRGAPADCETCHTSDEDEPREIRGAWQVTHGPDWRRTHGMGDQSSCKTCHPSNFCEKCHGVPVPHPEDFGIKHSQYAIENRRTCVPCHKNQQEFCYGCHGIRMPHPEGFLENHSAIAKGRGDRSCLRCHVDTDCATCHANHIHPGQGTNPAASAQASEAGDL